MENSNHGITGNAYSINQNGQTHDNINPNYVVMNIANQSTSLMAVPNSDVVTSRPPGGGKATPPSKNMKNLEKESEEYIRRRKRNNEAVKKSREKTREKTMSTLQKVEQLKRENIQLETKVEILTKELSILKDLFMEHARGFCTGDKSTKITNPEELEKMLGCKFKEGAFEQIYKFDNGETSQCSSKSEAVSISPIQPLISAAEQEYTNMNNTESNVKQEKHFQDASNNS